MCAVCYVSVFSALDLHTGFTHDCTVCPLHTITRYCALCTSWGTLFQISVGDLDILKDVGADMNL